MSRETRRALIAAAAAVGLTMTPAEAARLVEPTGYSELRQLVEAQPELQKAIIPGLGVAPLLMGKKASGPDISKLFTTTLWAGNGANRSIQTGIDSIENPSLVWIKSRSSGFSHYLFDTQRGAERALITTLSEGQSTETGSLRTFSVDGYNLGSASVVNAPSVTFVGWQFRKTEKFFNVITYTGNGQANRIVPHGLGVAPGLVIVKRYSSVGTGWATTHRSVTGGLLLNTSGAISTAHIDIQSSVNLSLSSNDSVNANGQAYVAYAFAHDPAADGLIQCGSYEGNGLSMDDGGNSIALPWVPQFVMIKCATISGNWFIFDTARGIPVHPTTGAAPTLFPNLSDSEGSAGTRTIRLNEPPWGTGFRVSGNDVNGYPSRTYIYMAIRAAA